MTAQQLATALTLRSPQSIILAVCRVVRANAIRGGRVFEGMAKSLGSCRNKPANPVNRIKSDRIDGFEATLSSLPAKFPVRRRLDLGYRLAISENGDFNWRRESSWNLEDSKEEPQPRRNSRECGVFRGRRSCSFLLEQQLEAKVQPTNRCSAYQPCFGGQKTT